MHTTPKRRACMSRDAKWMRRARRKYIARLSWWLEEDRERVYPLVQRLKDLGLYAASSAECSIRCSIITHLAKSQGHETPKLKRRWLMQTGWSAYWGWYSSPSRRQKSA